MPRRPSRSPAPALALLAALVAAPAAAVPVSPIAAPRAMLSMGDLVAPLASADDLAVTFGVRPAPVRAGDRLDGESVLLSNDPHGGFGFQRDRFRALEPTGFRALEPTSFRALEPVGAPALEPTSPVATEPAE